MKNDKISACIRNELLRLDLLKKESQDLIDTIRRALENRLCEEDSEDIITKKIYDVLFFWVGGSHLKDNPVNIKDYVLFAKRIKLAFEKQDSVVVDLLIKINELDSDIVESRNFLNKLHNKKSELVSKLYETCPHLEFTQKQLYYDDEYGTSHAGNMMRKCCTCGFSEEGVLLRPWIAGSTDCTFKKIIGTPKLPDKIRRK